MNATPVLSYIDSAIQNEREGRGLSKTEQLIIELLRRYPDGKVPHGGAVAVAVELGLGKPVAHLAAGAMRERYGAGPGTVARSAPRQRPQRAAAAPPAPPPPPRVRPAPLPLPDDAPECAHCGQRFDPEAVSLTAIKTVTKHTGGDPAAFCKPSCAYSKG